MKKFFLSVKNPQENYKWEKLPRKITQPRLIFLYLLTDGGWLVGCCPEQTCCLLLSVRMLWRSSATISSPSYSAWKTMTVRQVYFKGTVQRSRYLIFSSIEHGWATNQGVKLCSILVQISASYSNFSKAPRGIRPRGVDLPGVTNPKF